MLLNLATYVTTHSDSTVAVFNLEMGASQLANRIISSLGQIEGYKMRTGKLLNQDWKRFNEATTQLSKAKLYIDDTPGITIGEIRAKCRRLASSSDGLDLVIIDYLQLISGGKNYGSNRQQEVADISRSLKTLAMELHIPIIALAQLSRSVEGREDKRPMLSDLRESGSIEQDADLVGFYIEMIIIIKKQRKMLPVLANLSLPSIEMVLKQQFNCYLKKTLQPFLI